MTPLKCPLCGETRRVHRYDNGDCHCAFCGHWFDFDDEPKEEREDE